MWISLTKYPMNPMTAKPTATARQICVNSNETKQPTKCQLVVEKTTQHPNDLSSMASCNESRTITTQHISYRWRKNLTQKRGKHTWLPSRTNCWGISANSLTLSDIVVVVVDGWRKGEWSVRRWLGKKPRRSFERQLVHTLPGQGPTWLFFMPRAPRVPIYTSDFAGTSSAWGVLWYSVQACILRGNTPNIYPNNRPKMHPLP